jgi:predicted nucleic acid-binding protein
MRRVYLDACVVIYLIEAVGAFSETAKRFLERNLDAVLHVSPLVRLEVLIKPLRETDTKLVADYEDFLSAQYWLAINDQVVDRALRLRAQHGLRTPDALHLATALHYGCDEFWTNDDRLNKAAGPLAVNLLRPPIS